jgi:hypothetical protein
MRAREGSAALILAALLAAPAWGRELKVVARVSAGDGVIGDAFALDDRGAALAYVHTDAKGQVRLRVGPPGGRARGVDISSFTSAPERVLAVGGRFFLLANERQRRAAAVGPGGLAREMGPFNDVLASTRPPALVTLTERAEKEGERSLEVNAYRPDGSRLMVGKRLTVRPDGTLKEYPDKTFVGFGDGFLEVLVRQPGRYQKAGDVRGLPEVGMLDLRTGKVGGTRPLRDLDRFLGVQAQRNERPGVEAFVHLAEGGAGLELVGPQERVRPLRLPAAFERFEAASLRQQRAGARLVVSLAGDSLEAGASKSARRLHFFAVELGGARMTTLGSVPLEENQEYAWSAGGSRLAVLPKTGAAGGPELAVYGF